MVTENPYLPIYLDSYMSSCLFYPIFLLAIVAKRREERNREREGDSGREI